MCVYDWICLDVSIKLIFTVKILGYGTQNASALSLTMQVVQNCNWYWYTFYLFITIFIQVKIHFNKCTISNTVTNTVTNAFPVV